MKKRILSILLTLTMVMSLVSAMSITASAETDQTNVLLLNNRGEVCMTDGIVGNYPDIEGVISYNSPYITYVNGVFHFADGFNFATSDIIGMYLKHDLTLSIDGDVHISGQDFGIYSSKRLTIIGNGTLYVENTDDTNFAEYSNDSRPCALYAYKGLQISGNVKIVATGVSGGIDGSPISIDDDAVVKATGNKTAILSYDGAISSDDAKIYGNKNYNTYTDLKETVSVSNEDLIISDYSTEYYFEKVGDDIAKSVTMFAPVKYLVNVSKATNGSVSVDKESASKDETITVTVTPDEGYELDTLSYTPDEGSATDITSAKEFTMPASDVTVTATFKKASSITPSIADITSDSGYYADSINGSDKSGIIAFTSIFNNLATDFKDYTFDTTNDKFGIVVYKASDGIKDSSFKCTSTSFADLKNANSYFYSFVDDIAADNFDKAVYAIPFAIIGGTTYWGNFTSTTVNPEKWLGSISNSPVNE